MEKPVNYVRYWLKANINGPPITALVDPGAARTVIGKKIGIDYQKYSREDGTLEVKTARMANAQSANVLGEIRGTLEIQSVKKPVDIPVIPSIPTELIIGLDTIRQFKMDILGSCDKFTLADLGSK